MAGQNKTFNATVVGKVDIQGADATKLMKGLVSIQKDLTEGFKATANEARLAFDRLKAAPDSQKNLERLAKALGEMSRELKVIKTLDTSVKVVKDDDVRKAKELIAQMNQLAAIYKDMQKQNGIQKGTFGLDSTNSKEAIRKLKELEKASQAVNAAMTMKGDEDGKLGKYKTKIEANTKALIAHIDALRNATAMEKAHEQALAANAARDQGIRASRRRMEEQEALRARQAELKQIELNQKGFEQAERDKNLALKKALEERRRMNEEEALRQNNLLRRQALERKRLEDAEALRQNLALKAKQEMQYKLINSASAQMAAGKQALDLSAAGRAAGAFQLNQLSERTSLLANPAFQAQENARRQRQIEENALKQVYQQAGVRPQQQGFYQVAAADTNNTARVQAAQQIVGLQRQLVDLQMKGQLTDAESLRIRNQITAAIAQEMAARNKSGNQQAQQNQAERNMARIGGIGGASLMAVQASLMANYSILNGFTGSIRSAVSTSIELEAAFRNVQAVTVTTGTEMGVLEEKIKAVAANSKFSSIEVAQAALVLGQAGLSAKEVGEAIEPVTMLAAAAGTNLAQAVDLVTSVIGVFDKTANDTADIANKITAAANSSKVSVEKLALGFQYAGNTAAQMGVSFEETTAAMAAMSNAGIRSGSTMGTGLRQFLVETQKPSEEFMATISRIGLTMGDLDFKSNGLIGVARKLREAGFIASDAIKSFDVRGAAAFNALIANPEEMERQYRLLLNTKAGLAANEIQMDSLKSQATRLTTSLGNLASAGFEPLGFVLQKIAGAMATGIQLASEYKTTMAVVGTLIGGVLITTMVTYTATLVTGALALGGVSAASLTALRSMTLLGAGQSILAGMSAAWVALRGAVAAAGAAYTIAASQGVVASTMLTSTMAGLAAGTRALMAAIGGLSLMGGVGLILTAVAAGMYLFRDSSAAAREEMDKMKAASNEAKAAYDATKDTIDSLSRKISELNYKQQDTTLSSQDLTTTVMSLTSQFGANGFAADNTTNSYSGMIKKLKELRGEMQLLAEAKLKEAIRENGTLLKKQTEVAGDELTTLRKSGATRNIDTALSADNAKYLTASQQEKLRRARGQIEAGDTTNAGDVADIAPILRELSSTLKKVGGDRNRGNAMLFEGVANKTDNFSRANLDRMTTKAESAALGITQINAADTKKYDQRSINVGGKTMTLEQAKDTLGGNMRAKVPASGDRLKDYEKLYDLSQKEIEQLGVVLDNLEKDRSNPNSNKEVVGQNLTQVRGLMEGIKTEVQKAAKETQAKAEKEYKNQAMILKATAGSKDKKVAAQAIRDLAALDKKFKTRAIIDPDEKYNAEQAIEEAGNIRADNKLSQGSGRRIQDIVGEVKQRVLKLQEAELIREANTLKGDAMLSGDSEVSENLMNQGLAKLKQAGEKAVLAALLKQAEDLKNTPESERGDLDKSFKAEVLAIRADFAERAKQFVLSFNGFSGAAAKALRDMEDTLNKQKASLTNQKFASEERVYKESEGLRQLEREAALGKRTRTSPSSTTKMTYSTNNALEVKNGSVVQKDNDKDSNRTVTSFRGNAVSVAASSMGGTDAAFGGGTAKTTANGSFGSDRASAASSGATGTLKQRMSKEIVRVGQIELEENRKFLKLLGDSDSGMIATLTEQLKTATEAYDANKVRLDELQALMKSNGGKLTDAQREEMTKLTDSVPAQGKKVTEIQQDLRGAVKDRREARKEEQSIEVRIEENTRVLPQEVSFENVNKAIDKVWENYKETVGDMDAMAVLQNGMQAIMGNMTGSLSNAFVSMLDGTKTVKEAFRDMATSVIKAMLDVIAQALAMQAIKAMIGGFGGGGGASNVVPTAAATGGYINMAGRIERVRQYAGGGPVRGGVEGRDSVPAVLMPGEFVLKKQAVDAVGTDYLHSLNMASKDVVSSSGGKKPESREQGEPSVVNVWVVSPDEKPNTLGPRDVVAIISDDISRGGSVKKLIKQVVTNQA